MSGLGQKSLVSQLDTHIHGRELGLDLERNYQIITIPFVQVFYLNGIEQTSPPDQLDHTGRQLGHVLPQQLTHLVSVLSQLLLYQHL